MNPTLQTITHRDAIGDWLNVHGLTGEAAEVGVMHGGYSRIVLSKWKGQRMWLVDLWARQPADVYKEQTDNVPYDLKYLDCVKVAEDYPIVRLIRDYSVNAAKQIPDGSLDWVFIDANHAYNAVLEDMSAWWPKVKVGGLFSGHDFELKTEYPHWCEVKPAVEKWMSENKVPFVTTPCTSWWAIKE
jgi:hypothetical protein